MHNQSPHLQVLSLAGVFLSRLASDRRVARAAATTATVEATAEQSSPSIGQLQDDTSTLGLLHWHFDASQHAEGNSVHLASLLQVAAGTAAVTAGLIGIKLWDKIVGRDGPRGMEITWSYGIGLMGSAVAFMPLVYVGLHGRLPGRKDFGTRRDVLAGICCGVLAGLANLCMDVALNNGIQIGTVNTVMQSGIVIAGLWGIFYRELVGAGPILLFFVSSLAFLAGVTGLASSGG